MGDQLVAEAASYTTHNEHERQRAFTSADLQPVIPEIKWLQTYAFASTATSIGYKSSVVLK
jgi:hypothetical protein